MKLTKSVLIAGVITAGLMLPRSAQAAESTAKISFTFDDGLASTYTQAAPILAKYGISGTDYAISGCVGMTTAPNACRANPNLRYMSWRQLQHLQNVYGWEIGGHTASHPCLADSKQTTVANCQADPLTQLQLMAELKTSKQVLQRHGLAITDMAPPYGDYDVPVLAEIAKSYASMRGLKDQNNNVWPYSDYLLNDRVVLEGDTPVAQIKSAMDEAVARGTWLILTFHEINPRPSSVPGDYEYGSGELEQIAAYAKQLADQGKLQPVRVRDGLTHGANLLPGGSFSGGMGKWSTDAPQNVTLNDQNHGSYPNPKNSVEFTAGDAPIHLFSPQVAVDPAHDYVFKSFLNVEQNAGGTVGYYVDEYDEAGNWISGQYKKSETSVFVEMMNFGYRPSSPNVASARLQLIVTANSNIHAYVDNVQLLAQ